MASSSDQIPRLRKDAERNVQRILTAAREVFRERGVAATLDEVARRAEVGVGTVYRRFPNKEALVDALFDDIVEVLEAYVREGLAQPDAWLGLTGWLEKVCAVQACDRGLREVMLGSGRGPQREKQLHDRLGPLVDELVIRAQEQGTLRQDLVAADLPILQLMVGAVTAHTGQTELWRRYLAILLDGLQAKPGHPTVLVPSAIPGDLP